MRLFFLTVLSAAALGSCNNEDHQPATLETPSGDSLVAHSASDSEFVLPVKDTSHVADMNWRDSLIVYYLDHTTNSAVKATRKEGFRVEWLDNNTTSTDTATYFTYQLGHSFEGRFVTDAWVYIDSARRKLYEYDVAEDKLIKLK